MGDAGELWKAVKAQRMANRRRLGVACPGCPVVQPKRIPTLLMPGQRCKVCGHQDRRGGTKVNETITSDRAPGGQDAPAAARKEGV